MKSLNSVIVAAVAAIGFTTILAQESDDNAVLSALRGGGHVIVMRHASSPRARPTDRIAASGNVDRERQLDEKGRETASLMGKAIDRLAIPVGEVLSSPTFRALETARLLDLAEPIPIAELGVGGQGMQQDSEGARSAWLREKAADSPLAGTNRLMITHVPNLVGAFGDAAAEIAEGESLVIDPQDNSAVVVARVKIEQWAQLDVSSYFISQDPSARPRYQ